MIEAKRGKGRPYKGVIQRTYTLPLEIAEYIDGFPDGQRSDIVASAIKQYKQKQQEIAQQAVLQAREEGLDSEDATWMAVGTVNREARKQGIIGDELSAEMNAADQEIVKDVHAS